MQYKDIARICACFNFRRASRAITSLFNQTLSPVNLTSSQFVLLLVLALHSEMRMTELAEILGVDRTTLTRLVSPLKRRKLIAIGSLKEDRRSRVARLLRQGKEQLDAAIPYWQQAQSKIEELFGMSQWNAMVEKLTKASTVSAKYRQR